MLIRFAGPRLEQGGDELLPVALRRGGRSLGGSLSWSTPQPLAPFESTSPFRGLTVPDDVKVNRQVLADPTVATDAQIWARLADGTPLVTASSQGEGWIVLFHVTANSDWSNLPLSGLFVEMLRRAVTMGPSKVDVTAGDQSQAAAEPSKAASQTAAPTQRLAADPDARRLRPIDAAAGSCRAAFVPTRSTRRSLSPDHPPGYYGPSGAARAFNIITAKTVLKPLKPIEGAAQVSGYVMRKPMPLEPWLYLAVLALFALDVLIVVLMSSGWSFSRRASASRGRCCSPLAS